MEIVKRVKTDRLILVTSGIWGQSYDNAKKVIFDLYDCYKQREQQETKVILRLSVDKWHCRQLGVELIDNIINIYKEYFRNEINFELQIHTLIGDLSVDEVARRFGNCTIVRTDETGISDNENIVKISPYRCRMEFDDGYVIYVGIARTFYSNLQPDLRKHSEIVSKAVKIFDEDIRYTGSTN